MPLPDVRRTGFVVFAVAVGLVIMTLQVGNDGSSAVGESAPKPAGAKDGGLLGAQNGGSVVSDAAPIAAAVDEAAGGGRDYDSRNKRFVDKYNPLRAMDAPTDIQCPAFRFPSSKSADGKSIHDAVSKYSRYVHQYCNRTGLLQMNVEGETYGYILDTLAKVARIPRNGRIFDWGSGCGTMLNYYHVKFNTTGIGIDVTESAVNHARTHAQPRQLFCHLDGALLKSFPSNAFDAVVSWATLYHVRRTLVQCDIVHQLIRMLKPGGVAYMGHLRTEKTQEYWKKMKCTHVNATMTRYRDFKTFHQPSWKRHQFFSIVVTKHTEDRLVPFGAEKEKEAAVRRLREDNAGGTTDTSQGDGDNVPAAAPKGKPPARFGRIETEGDATDAEATSGGDDTVAASPKTKGSRGKRQRDESPVESADTPQASGDDDAVPPPRRARAVPPPPKPRSGTTVPGAEEDD